MEKIYKVTGKDSFGCKSQLKADGFVWVEEIRAWLGTQKAIDTFRTRGFRVKVFFSELDCSRAPAIYAAVTGVSLSSL